MQKPTLCIYGTDMSCGHVSVEYTHGHLLPTCFDISLSVADNSNPSLKNVIKPHEDEEGHKYIMVKSDEGYSYAKSLK